MANWRLLDKFYRVRLTFMKYVMIPKDPMFTLGLKSYSLDAGGRLSAEARRGHLSDAN